MSMENRQTLIAAVTSCIHIQGDKWLLAPRGLEGKKLHMLTDVPFGFLGNAIGIEGKPCGEMPSQGGRVDLLVCLANLRMADLADVRKGWA